MNDKIRIAFGEDLYRAKESLKIDSHGKATQGMIVDSLNLTAINIPEGVKSIAFAPSDKV